MLIDGAAVVGKPLHQPRRDRIAAVCHGNQLGVSFHPELDDDLRIHELLVSLI